MKKVILFVVLSLFSARIFAQTKEANDGSASRPFVLGVVDEIHSKVLSENRILNIYLPEGYQKSDTVRYPVVYLLDGSVDEDFIHIAGLYQFDAFPWVGRVSKSIVVGIANIDRMANFTFPTSIANDKKKFPSSGQSAKFIEFIKEELQPFIERKYRTNNSRTLIGESLGGLLATEILLKSPNLFNKYIIVSPSLWWDNGSLLSISSDVLSKSFSQPTEIYIGVGKEGLTPTEIPRVMEVDANLLADKLRKSQSKSLKVYFDYLPDENHATVMHQAVYNALKMMHDGK